MARIELQDVSKVYGGNVRAVNGLSLDIPDGDFMVFQNYALYPHMTVEDNLAFGLQLRKTPKEEQRKRVAEAAKMLALEPFLKRKPAALSGGQRQREGFHFFDLDTGHAIGRVTEGEGARGRREAKTDQA
jgi:ABC-type sugar transport system ATPase subunit